MNHFGYEILISSFQKGMNNTLIRSIGVAYIWSDNIF